MCLKGAEAPKRVMPKGACAHLCHPWMPPASTDITGLPSGKTGFDTKGGWGRVVFRYKEGGGGVVLVGRNYIMNSHEALSTRDKKCQLHSNRGF